MIKHTPLQLRVSMVRIWIGCLLTLIFLALDTSVKADDSVSDRLSRFIATCKSSETTSNTRVQPHQYQALELVLNSLKAKDYGATLEAISRIQTIQLPDGDLAMEWSAIVKDISHYLEQIQSQKLNDTLTNLQSEVDEFRQACLKAKKSTDLNPWLVKTSSREWFPIDEREHQKTDPVARRISYMKHGITRTLEVWCSFLDFMDSGDNNSALYLVRDRLLSQSNNYPVLPRSEIEKRLPKGTHDAISLSKLIEYVTFTIRSADDIPGVLEQLNSLKFDSPEDGYRIESTKKELSSLYSIHQQLKNGQPALALERVQNFFVTREFTHVNEMLKRQIQFDATRELIIKISGLTPGEDESLIALYERARMTLGSKGDFKAVAEIYDYYNRATQPGWSANVKSFDTFSNERLISAKKMESDGDLVGALKIYRELLRSPKSLYFPAKDCVEGIKRIESSNQDLVLDPTYLVLDELQAIHDRMKFIASSLNRF